MTTAEPEYSAGRVMPPIQVTFSAPLTSAGQVVRLALALTVILGMAFGRPSAVPVREILVFALVVVPIPLWLTLRWLGRRAMSRGCSGDRCPA